MFFSLPSWAVAFILPAVVGTVTGAGYAAGYYLREHQAKVRDPFGLLQGAPARHVKAFTARATMSPKSASATVDWTSIVYFARSVSGITSVGLNAVAFVMPRCR